MLHVSSEGKYGMWFATRQCIMETKSDILSKICHLLNFGVDQYRYSRIWQCNIPICDISEVSSNGQGDLVAFVMPQQ